MNIFQTAFEFQSDSKIEIRKMVDDKLILEIPTAPCPPEYQCSFNITNGHLTVNLLNATFEDGLEYYIRIENRTVQTIGEMGSSIFTDERWNFTYHVIKGI